MIQLLTLLKDLMPLLIGLCVLGFLVGIPLLVAGIIVKMHAKKSGLFTFSWIMMLSCVVGLFLLVTVWGLLGVLTQM